MSGLSVNTVPSASSSQVTTVGSGQSFGYGSLSKQQLDTLRAAVGYDFNWPPTADSGPFPLAAALAAHHYLKPAIYVDQLLTEDNLKTLAAMGALDDASVARGTAFLRGDRAVDNTSAVRRPAPGSVTSDGSIYL